MVRIDKIGFVNMSDTMLFTNSISRSASVGKIDFYGVYMARMILNL